MTARNSSRPVTELHQAILDFIWEAQGATSEQVRAALHARYPLKDSSVRTLLRRLEERGYLTHRVDGKAFVYRAVVPPSRVAARAVRQMIDRFWSGSAEQFLVGMVDENVLSVAEIEKLAERVKKEKGKSRKRGRDAD